VGVLRERWVVVSSLASAAFAREAFSEWWYGSVHDGGGALRGDGDGVEPPGEVVQFGLPGIA